MRTPEANRCPHCGAGQQFLTTAEVANLWRVSRDKVVGWIRSGKLRAINTNPASKRPRYVIDPKDLADLKDRLTVPVPPQKVRTTRQRTPPVGGPLDPDLGKALAAKGEAELVSGKYYRVWDGIILFY